MSTRGSRDSRGVYFSTECPTAVRLKRGVNLLAQSCLTIAPEPLADTGRGGPDEAGEWSLSLSIAKQASTANRRSESTAHGLV